MSRDAVIVRCRVCSQPCVSRFRICMRCATQKSCQRCGATVRRKTGNLHNWLTRRYCADCLRDAARENGRTQNHERLPTLEHIMTTAVTIMTANLAAMAEPCRELLPEEAWVRFRDWEKDPARFVQDWKVVLSGEVS